MRFFILLIACLVTVLPAYGQSLHFISLAWVTADKQAQYDRFSDLVAPIWARHGMEVLLRARVIGVLDGDSPSATPTEIALLRIADRQQFRNYIADPAYRAIRSMRTNAVDQMIVLESTETPSSLDPRLATAPQFLLTLGVNESPAADPVFQITTSQTGSIKGVVPTRYARPRHLTLFALSYDDNPMDFGVPMENETDLFILQRHN